MMHTCVADLLAECPFLATHLNQDDFDLPTVVFGQTATLVMGGSLPAPEVDRVFGHFNALSERGGSEASDILGTGAIEMFNDNAKAQRLARAKLKGRAREMLEEFRLSLGQPDYGEVA